MNDFYNTLPGTMKVAFIFFLFLISFSIFTCGSTAYGQDVKPEECYQYPLCSKELHYYTPDYGQHDLCYDNEQELLSFLILDMREIDETLYSTGQERTIRIPVISSGYAYSLAGYALRASSDTDNPFGYALAALIIAGYETGWRPNTLGDCFIYDNLDNPNRYRSCRTEEERANELNYRSCGMTQVRSNDRNPGSYQDRPYSCEELMHPFRALNYTVHFLEEHRTESGFWDISKHGGAGPVADAYEARHQLIMSELLTRSFTYDRCS